MKLLLATLALVPTIALAQIGTVPSVPSVGGAWPSLRPEPIAPIREMPMPPPRPNAQQDSTPRQSPYVQQDFTPRDSFRVYDPQSSVGATSGPPPATKQRDPNPGDPQAQYQCLNGVCFWIWK